MPAADVTATPCMDSCRYPVAESAPVRLRSVQHRSRGSADLAGAGMVRGKGLQYDHRLKIGYRVKATSSS